MSKFPINSDQRQINILGVRVDNITIDELFEFCKRRVANNEKAIIMYVNVYALNIAYSLPWFRKFLLNSSITFCDGFGVRLAARLTGQELPNRLTPPDFIEKIASLASEEDWKFFFLGAQQGVAQLAARKIKNNIPGLQIETRNGFFDKERGSYDNKQLILQINNFKPQLLILGFGMPTQERWILENINDLKVNIIFPAGALFDYMAGYVRRAPRWMTDHGFEWLGRLLIEPGRLWRRYLIGIPVFCWRIFVHHILGFPLPYE